MKKLAPLFVLMASVLWGSMGIVTRYVADIGFTTRQTAAVRICSAAAVLILFLLITDHRKLKIEKQDLKWFLGTGLGSLFINNLAYAETVQRAVSYTHLSGGYSPHMIMSFAQPLGVGLTSDGEYMDVELKAPIASAEAVERLNKAMVEGVEVVSFREIRCV